MLVRSAVPRSRKWPSPVERRERRRQAVQIEAYATYQRFGVPEGASALWRLAKARYDASGANAGPS
jgi:hypothetical protein